MDSPQRLARLTGLLYLVIAICGLLAPLALGDLDDPVAASAGIGQHPSLFAAGLVGWIVLVLADTAAAVTLYLLLRRVHSTLAAVTAAVRLVYSAMLGAGLIHLGNAFSLQSAQSYRDSLGATTADTLTAASLGTFDTGFALALIIFGVHCLGLGVLFWRSRYIPRPLAALLLAAGIGYITDNLIATLAPAANPDLTVVLLAPALVGELGLTFWLLIKGVNHTPGLSATATSSPTTSSSSGN